jgi:hypothetical protein
VFFEAAERRRLPRPSGRVVAVAAALATAVAAGALIAGRDSPPPPPDPVGALEAERRLELRFGRSADDETAAVRCPHRIEADRTIRCELRYSDGIARAILVRLSPRGELEADVPYPATLRR